MDTRKVTFIATIAAIVLVAVGIGYAYTAITSNTNNYASAEYIILTQTDDGGDKYGDYQFANTEKVYWDSDNSKVLSGPQEGKIKTVYTLTDTTTPIAVCGMTFNSVAVGKPIQIEANPQKAGGAILTSLAGTFQTTGFTATTGGSFIVAIDDNKEFASPSYSLCIGDNVWTNTMFTIAGSTSYAKTYVQVYYGYTGEGVITYDDSAAAVLTNPNRPADEVLNGATISFAAKTPAGNGSYKTITTIDKTGTASISTLGGTTTLTAVAKSGDESVALPGNGTWYLVNPGVNATVVDNEDNTATFTAVLNGTAYAVYKTSDGKFSMLVEITITNNPAPAP